jgi:calcium-dependent protein kinase
MAKGKLSRVERLSVTKEVAIMKMMDHPSIIKLYETFEDRYSIYLVMELCQGGQLYDRITEVGCFSEVEAASVMQQVLRTVFYMHQHRICHRDLKPENFVFQSVGPVQGNVLKLIDFGLSSEFKEGQPMSTRAGTPYYVAPEVLAKSYNHLCDTWSAGVIMYILLSGSPPFDGKDDQEILSKAKRGDLVFDPIYWKGISEDAKELIRYLVKVDASSRFTAEQALNHRWVHHRAPMAINVPLRSKSFVDTLRAFPSRNKFVKAALHVIAAQLSDMQIKSLRDTFISLDNNGDGLLTLSELRDGLKHAGLAVQPSELRKIMEGVDADGSGAIDYTEFLAATLQWRHLVQEDVCWSAFCVLDLNGDGKISADELWKVLNLGGVGAVVNAQVIVDALREVDKNGDGCVDFGEFMSMMRTLEGMPAENLP